jgi:alpha-L-arabinofuranosidase
VRGGESVRAVVTGGAGGTFDGETLPRWLGEVVGGLKVLDVAAVRHAETGKLVVAVVNRSEREDVFAEIRVAFSSLFASGAQEIEAEVHEIWDEDVKATNEWADVENGGKERVRAKTSVEKLKVGKKGGVGRVWKKHSVGVVVLDVVV